MKKVLVITGPTAVGKSALAITLAKQFNGEIISGDSIQVYKGFDIGSGKIKDEEMAGVPHHLLDVLQPQESFSVYDFQTLAREKIENCEKLPILCGGTGLYLKGCLFDYQFDKDSQPVKDDPYPELNNEQLYQKLVEVDSEQAKKMHPNNRRRVLRSLHIYQSTGTTQSQHESQQTHTMIYDTFLIGCTLPREQLYQRINQRVEEMFAEGLVDEVNGLLKQGVQFNDQPMRGIGYKEFQPYFEGQQTLEQVKKEIQKHSREFAKKQYTWLNHQFSVRWLDMNSTEDKQQLIKEITSWQSQ